MNPESLSTRPELNRFSDRNDVVRVDVVENLDDQTSTSLRTFYRAIGASHLFEERIEPSLRQDSTRLFVAMRDRPWPPWGLGGRVVAAVCQVNEIGEALFGLGPVYVADDEVTNIGMIGATLKAVLEEVSRQEGSEVAYLVRDGSVLAPRVLERFGFTKTDDAVVTEAARYSFYRASAGDLADQLGLSQTSTSELLAHSIDSETFEALSWFYSSLYLGGHAELRTDLVPPEIAQTLSGIFTASLPGGTPPPPPPPGSDRYREFEEEIEEVFEERPIEELPAEETFEAEEEEEG